MESINIKKILSKIRIPKRKEFRTISAKSHHDWKMILILFFVLSLLFVVGNTYFFFKINKGEIFINPTEEAGEEGVISEKKLEGAVDFFEDRQIRLERLQSEIPTIIDPSL